MWPEQQGEHTQVALFQVLGNDQLLVIEQLYLNWKKLIQFAPTN
jgi:hypothetical protein